MELLGRSILKILAFSAVGIFVFLLVYFLLKTLFVKLKTGKTFSETVTTTEYIKFVDFIKWVVIDTLRGKDRLKLYGIWAYTGYYGEGKTLGAVLYAKHLQKKYPHRNIKIFSNIDVVGQEAKITNWKEMLDLPKNSIMIYDESQSDWSSTIGVSAFPEDFLRRITQVRKKQLAFFMTSPVFTRMNINLRESVNFVIECRNVMGLDRMFKYVFYRTEEYEKMIENPEKKRKRALFSETFIAADSTYKLYDTTQEVESIKDVGETKVTKRETTNLKKIMDDFRNQIHKEMDDKIKQQMSKIAK